MKVALVHDYLKEYGGAERVLEAIHKIYPDSTVFTAYYEPHGLGSHKKDFKDWNINTSWIQKIPWAGKLLSPLRILAPVAFESFDLTGFDLVISSCNIYFAKAVITNPKTLNISYIHSPPRYLYGFATSFNYKKFFLTRIAAEISNHILRVYDFETSQRPDILIANSKTVQARIKKFYRRDSTVIYPPVDISKFSQVKKQKGEYFLALNRLWKSKGTDIIIKACTNLNLPLKVASTGPEFNNLKSIAGKSVEFLGDVSDDRRIELLAGAKALIVSSEEEDFGINAIESMAAGTPVIAIRSGGYLETIVEGKTGDFFDPDNPLENLSEVLQNFNPDKYKELDCIEQAKKFSQDEFERKIKQIIKDNLDARAS